MGASGSVCCPFLDWLADLNKSFHPPLPHFPICNAGVIT